MAMMGGMGGGVPPADPTGGMMMPQGSPTADPQIPMLIQMLLGGAMQGMSQTATDPNTLLQMLMSQQGPAPMQPPMDMGGMGGGMGGPPPMM